MAEPFSKYRVSRGTPPLVYQQLRRAQSVPTQWDVWHAAGERVRRSWAIAGQALRQAMDGYSSD